MDARATGRRGLTARTRTHAAVGLISAPTQRPCGSSRGLSPDASLRAYRPGRLAARPGVSARAVRRQQGLGAPGCARALCGARVSVLRGARGAVETCEQPCVSARASARAFFFWGGGRYVCLYMCARALICVYTCVPS